MLSKRLDYGMRILYELALSPDEFQAAGELADRHHVPEAFLRKILQDLRRAGVVTSQKGRTGGYRLARSPHRVSVAEVVDALKVRLPYLIGEEYAMDENCPTAPLWRHLEAHLSEELARLTIWNVVEMAQKEGK